MTIEDVKDISSKQLFSLPASQRNKYLSTLFSVVNKRVARLNKNIAAGKFETTPTAIKRKVQAGYTAEEKFAISGKTERELKKEYATAMDVLSQRTSTVKGALHAQEFAFKELARKATLSKEQQKLMWRVYNEVENRYAAILDQKYNKDNYGSDRMQNFIEAAVKETQDFDEIMHRVEVELGVYQRQFDEESTPESGAEDVLELGAHYIR